MFKPVTTAMRLHLSFLTSLALLIATNGYPVVVPVNPAEPQPIDVLQIDLQKTYQSKQARILKLAYDALLKESFTSSIQLASPLQKDERYSDFAFWILSSAYRGQSLKQLQNRAFLPAFKSAQKAVSLSLQIEVNNPYSPFLKLLPRDVACAELLMADATYELKKTLYAQRAYETSFQRLQNINSLALVNPESLDRYAQLCKKKSGLLCESWIQRFLSIQNKKFQKTVLKHFPNVSEKTKSWRSAKQTMTYKSPDLDQIAIDTAMKYYFDENYSQAIKALRQFQDDYPRSGYRNRGRFWLAQAFKQDHNEEEAQKILLNLQLDSPLTYYGFLASLSTGRTIDSAFSATLPTASATDPALRPSELFHLVRARELIAEKAYNLASYELKDLKARDNLSSPFLVYLSMLNYRAKNFNNGFQLLGELIQRGYEGVFSSYGLRMVFPVDYYPSIVRFSGENVIDPILVLSLIKQESAFDEEANSSSGALGLMQLMPATASDVDAEVKITDLLNADRNISTGVKYLKKLLVRYNGNIIYALAGYNAGPNALDRWVRDVPVKRNAMEFIESIPYKETREYVASIIRNYFWYSRKLNGSFDQNINYFWSNPASTRTDSKNKASN